MLVINIGNISICLYIRIVFAHTNEPNNYICAKRSIVYIANIFTVVQKAVKLGISILFQDK